MRRTAGFTIVELAVVLVILAVLAAIVFPFFRSPHKSYGAHCASNEKQIALAALMYCQDWDERFPPVVGAEKVNGVVRRVNWAGGAPDSLDGRPTPGLLLPYIKDASILVCPVMPRGSTLTYMYNDLAATVKAEDIPAPALTVLLTEGENQAVNAGHAWQPGLSAADCWQVKPKGDGCAARGGATVGDAPSRHSNGANYAFTDGHVKWRTPGTVYFPPRASDGRKHGPCEPDPAGDMSVKERHYAGTFHVR